MEKEERDAISGLSALPGFPLVLVTVGKNIMTAAAFSFYSFEPQPAVMVGIRPQNFTFNLIKEKLEYGINLPTQHQLDIVRYCGSVSGRVENKYAKAGLTPFKGKVIESYLIKECPINLECRVVHQIQHSGSHHWFIGEIQAAHVNPEYSRGTAVLYWSREYRAVGKVLKVVKK